MGADDLKSRQQPGRSWLTGPMMGPFPAVPALRFRLEAPQPFKQLRGKTNRFGASGNGLISKLGDTFGFFGGEWCGGEKQEEGGEAAEYLKERIVINV